MERINTEENLLKTNTILDDYLKFYKSQIYLIFGETGVGKSSFLLDLGIRFVKNGYNGIFISNQMSTLRTSKRIISNLFNISLNSEDEIFKLYTKDNIEYLKENFCLAEVFNSLGLEQLIKGNIKKNQKIDFIILDDLESFIKDENMENEKEYYKKLIDLIEEIAYKYNILILTTSYYNDKLKFKKDYFVKKNIDLEELKISVKDLKFNEIFEPKLSSIIGLNPINFNDKEKVINLQILKQRFGTVNSNININFNTEYQQFNFLLSNKEEKYEF